MIDTGIIQLITSVGFPIVACCVMGWYVKYTTDKCQADLANEREQHRLEMEKITEALNNNTLAITRLCDKLDIESKEVL